MARGSIATRLGASRLLVLAALLLPVTACNSIQVRQPKTENLIGTYRLDEASQHFLTTYKGYATLPETAIEIRSNKTIRFANLPDCAVSLTGDGNGTFVYGSGRWELRKDFLSYGLDLVIDKGGTIEAGGFYNWLNLRGGPSRFSLEIYLGDPDQAETLLYVRQAS
jgi:hypothetical protein